MKNQMLTSPNFIEISPSEAICINGGTTGEKDGDLFDGKHPIYRFGQLAGAVCGGVFLALKGYIKSIEGNTAYASPVGR